MYYLAYKSEGAQHLDPIPEARDGSTAKELGMGLIAKLSTERPVSDAFVVLALGGQTQRDVGPKEPTDLEIGRVLSLHRWKKCWNGEQRRVVTALVCNRSPEWTAENPVWTEPRRAQFQNSDRHAIHEGILLDLLRIPSTVSIEAV